MTKLIPSLLLATTFLLPIVANAERKDPYADIEKIQLENGLVIFLAPSSEATRTDIKIEVDAGIDSETPSNLGVSHLLEHMLFRDKELKDEMSYLQLIKEAGGSANGSTDSRHTKYFGSIPSAKSLWLLETVSNMVLNPNFTEEYLEKEKGTVELERGRPGPVTQIIGFDPSEILYPRYLQRRDFWESEFKVSFAEKYSLSQEQLSTQRLTLEKVKRYYNDYYYASNIRLFIAGKFDRTKVMEFIDKTWGKLPARSGLRLPPHQRPSPKEHPYYQASIYEETPYVVLGTKIWGADYKESEIIAAFSHYLAHRLMKEIRNRKGQTYTARADTNIARGYGFSTISFETQREKLSENIEVVRSYLRNEAGKGTLSDADVAEAVKLYLDQYDLHGREAHDMMWLADDRDTVEHGYGSFTSPYELMRNVTPEEFRSALKKHFRPERRYEAIWRPALFFAYDYYLAYFLLGALAFLGLRRLLTKSFANDKIRWVRNIAYPPLFVYQAAALLFAWYCYSHVNFALDYIIEEFGLLPPQYITLAYLHTSLSVVIALVIPQTIFALLPKKLMVADGHLFIKSMTYYSRKIPLSEIAKVEVANPWRILFSVKKLIGIKARYFWFDPLPWRSGITIQLKSGQTYFFSVKASKKVVDELIAFLPSQEGLDQRVSEAA